MRHWQQLKNGNGVVVYYVRKNDVKLLVLIEASRSKASRHQASRSKASRSKACKYVRFCNRMQNKLPSPRVRPDAQKIKETQLPSHLLFLTTYCWLYGHFKWDMIISPWWKVLLPTFPFWIESFRSAQFQGTMVVFAGLPVEVGDTLLVASYYQACFQG